MQFNIIREVDGHEEIVQDYIGHELVLELPPIPSDPQGFPRGEYRIEWKEVPVDYPVLGK